MSFTCTSLWDHLLNSFTSVMGLFWFFGLERVTRALNAELTTRTATDRPSPNMQHLGELPSMDTNKVSRRTLPPLRMWVREAAWFQDGLTHVINERGAKEALVFAVAEMHGNVKKLGPNWGNMEVPLSEWKYTEYNYFKPAIVSWDRNILPTYIKLHSCSLRGPMSLQLCRLTTLVQLDLTWGNITDLHYCICNLKRLTHLRLTGNKLTTLPDSIGNLTNLTELYVTCNQLTTLPDSIGNLTNLAHLYLADNQLTTLPDSIGNLTHLTNLDLSRNQITICPDFIGNLITLLCLKMSGNQLTNLPGSISNLTNLQTLDLYRNQLTTLPDSIGNLTNLTTLALFSNQLTTLPASIRNCTRLHSIELYQNLISYDEQRRIRAMFMRVRKLTL